MSQQVVGLHYKFRLYLLINAHWIYYISGMGMQGNMMMPNASMGTNMGMQGGIGMQGNISGMNQAGMGMMQPGMMGMQQPNMINANFQKQNSFN